MVNRTDLIHLCKCSECPLNGKYVLGEGTGTDSHYQIVFIGMAPAKEEIKTGRPFVGRAGQLLRESTKRLGYTDYYITNTLLCELPEDISSKDEQSAIDCCKERLFEELRLVKPKLTIALGNMPLKVLTGRDYGILSVEGRVLEGIVSYVMPVRHPASVLRRTEEYFDYRDALKSALKWVSGTYQQAVVPETVVVDDNNIGEVLQILDNAGEMVVDLETTGRGFYPYGRDPDQIRCVVVAIDKKTAYIFPGKSSPYFEPHTDFSQHPGLKEVINKSRLIMHNGQFDCGFLMQAGYKPKIFFDTMLAHYCLDEREYSHSLKELSKKHLGAPDWEQGIKKFLPTKASSYDLIPDEDLYGYASQDATYNYQLYKGWLGDEMSGHRVFNDLLMPSANMFNEIRHRGIRIDPDVLFTLNDELDTGLQEATKEFQELVGHYINPFSPQEVIEYLYDELKLPVLPRFGKSSSKKVLEYYRGMPLIDKLIECRELGKLSSTYVVGLVEFIDSNVKIHPFTKLFGTVTGRISTEDPSVMNIVKKGKIMNMYVPEKGHLVLAADQKQMELRCYVVITGDEFLRNILLTSDPHEEVRQEIIRRKGGKQVKREQAKGGVFGAIYGRGIESFKYGFQVSDQVARDIREIILNFIPSIKEYNRGIRNEVHRNGYLESYFGRKRRFGLITDENRHELYRMGGNFKVQSMATDINLFCMLHLWGMKDKLGIWPLFPVHDNIIIDIESTDSVPLVRQEIEEYSKYLVGGKMEFKVDCKVGPSLGEVTGYNGD